MAEQSVLKAQAGKRKARPSLRGDGFSCILPLVKAGHTVVSYKDSPSW